MLVFADVFQIAQDHPVLAIMLIVAAPLATAILGYFAGLQKNIVEVRKLRAESTKLGGDFLVNIQAARRRYSDAAARCGDLASNIYDVVVANAGAVEMNRVREAFCRSISCDVIPAFIDDVEWKFLEHNGGNPDELQTVVDDAVEELRRFQRWLAAINDPRILAEINRNPHKITDRTFRAILKEARKLPSSMKNGAVRAINAEVQRLVNPQQ